MDFTEDPQDRYDYFELNDNWVENFPLTYTDFLGYYGSITCATVDSGEAIDCPFTEDAENNIYNGGAEIVVSITFFDRSILFGWKTDSFGATSLTETVSPRF